MGSTTEHIRLAQSLPPRLLRFFAHNPPRFVAFNASEPLAQGSSNAVDNPPPVDENITALPSDKTNPFLAHKNPRTGAWHPPIYSLRRQADLVKLAERHGVVELLPYSKKKAEERLKKRAEGGLRVKGTGVGQKVKGSISERTLPARLEKRRKAMLDMPRLIQEWKERGHGRGWKHWPK